MNLFLPGISLEIESNSSDICLSLLGSSLFTEELCPSELRFHCTFDLSEQISRGRMVTVLKGEPFEGVEIAYRWEILKDEKNVGIYLEFFEDDQFKEVLCRIDFDQKKIHTIVVPKSNGLVNIDPLSSPFGAILMVVLAQHQNDIIVHASGIMDEGVGRLFTAVSGTGKSTMAGLWGRSGAKVINDDRLWLRKIDGQWCLFNTPMPYYAQKPALAPLNEIFVIRQSVNNELNRVFGVKGAMLFMANATQHYYDREMTAQHLDRVFNIARNIPIYDCGFRPDSEIVAMIRRL
ncbi:hypothetical protein ACT29H_00240 [Thermophagus sp. OGC60D27]|uniref:hypothetical protein n=1 Tax=Thermophagus sp. OGC60D27 TaxID=3458415 RepID=UPI00403782E0